MKYEFTVPGLVLPVLHEEHLIRVLIEPQVDVAVPVALTLSNRQLDYVVFAEVLLRPLLLAGR